MNSKKLSGRQELSIGGLSAASGVHIETIRYYERIGIAPKPPRTTAGHRVYGDVHIKRFVFVRRGRELGFTLDQVRTLLDLADGSSDTCAKVKVLTLDHLTDVEKKITDLERLREVLSDHADQCEGDHAPDCPLIESLYAA
jgi:MerR family transcriptional regulator, mercuric resistance operon regulatory protein